MHSVVEVNKIQMSSNKWYKATLNQRYFTYKLTGRQQRYLPLWKELAAAHTIIGHYYGLAFNHLNLQTTSVKLAPFSTPTVEFLASHLGQKIEW
jgi:hypothetical protein